MTRPGSADYVVARVSIWGQDVGAVAEDRGGDVVFEYADGFRRSGLELSPVHLPLSLKGPVAFPELRRVDSFSGLPGLLADSLPDAFGNAVIRRYFEQRGTPDAALSPVQKLLYLGSRAMGALEFHPQLDRELSQDTGEALAIAHLVQEARRVVEGDPSVALPEMMQLGASAGGARAKAMILWNRDQRRVKSAFAPRGEGDEHWLIKFDGVTGGTASHAVERDFVPGPWGRIEFAYSRMARAAGIEVEETYLLREREFAHFMARRFYREGDARLHLHTLGGMLHADYNVRQVLSYEDWFRTILRLGLGQPAVDEAYRRMVFNLAARNQDDHVKNVAFLMGPEGAWWLAPAYDLSWAMGGRWTVTHQMTAAGKDDGFTRHDLLGIGAAFDVEQDGAGIIDEVDAALAGWRMEAEAVELGAEWVERVERSFRRFG